MQKREDNWEALRPVVQWRFFLGGRDLEMIEIASLLAARSQAIVDHELAWGAALSGYAPLIERAVEEGARPVAVELADDMPADWRARAFLTIVDHHGARAGATVPTSLEQVARLVGAEADADTRWRRLVSANDRGHVAGMLAIGASPDEIRAIRAADRLAQGITEADEAGARDAIARREITGRLTVVTVDASSATAVSDLVLPELGGPGADRLLVVLAAKLAGYGDGPMIAALADAVPQSWWGGSLPERGFWGAYRRDAPPVGTIVALLQSLP